MVGDPPQKEDNLGPGKKIVTSGVGQTGIDVNMVEFQLVKVAYFEVSVDADVRIYIRDISDRPARDAADNSVGTSFQVRTYHKDSVKAHFYTSLKYHIDCYRNVTN